MRYATVVFLILSANAIAQEYATAELVTKPFLESYQPEVSVSGNVIVGVMTGTVGIAMLNNDLVVHAVPGGNHAELCLRVASRDGIYTSRNIYTLPEDVNGPVLLPYPSTQTSIVKDYGIDEIALAANVGNCDSASTDYFLLSAADHAGPANVVIYVNSFGATDVFYEIGADVNECEYISEGRRTTYDFICRLESVSAGIAVPVKIIRERFGREQPAVQMTIVGAAQ